MPNRILNEGICSSDTIDGLKWFEEVLFYRLLVNCDDYGRFDGRPAIIKNRLFPLKENLTLKAVSDGIYSLANSGLVVLYECEGKPFLYLPTWTKFQTVRAKKSKYPSPDEAVKSSEIICKQTQADVPVIQSNSYSESKSKKGAVRADRTPLEIAMDDFAAARKAMKKPLTDKARELTIKELEKLAPGDEAMQIAIINQSIQRGWQGVFPLKDDSPHPAPAAKAPEKPVSWRDGPTYLPDWAEDNG